MTPRPGGGDERSEEASRLAFPHKKITTQPHLSHPSINRTALAHNLGVLKKLPGSLPGKNQEAEKFKWCSLLSVECQTTYCFLVIFLGQKSTQGFNQVG